MTASALRFFGRIASIALAFSLFGMLASCGSGAVSGAPAVNDPTRITILPGTGSTLYSGQPTTFVLSGGTGSYIASSSNQAVIPVAGIVSGNTLTVVPNAVTADTTVTITVRDTGSTPVQTAVVTVKPGTVNNDVTVTPSSTQGAACPTGTLCSGGDAVVSVTLSVGGVALAGRTVRFDAISGDFRFITSPSGASPETLSTAAFVTTDEAGRASARIRATADAPNQTALVQVTDIASGAFRQVSFVIAQATGTSPGFVVSPDTISFTGARADQCASSGSATVFIFGGAPPYSVSSTTTAFSVSRQNVSFSGGSFDVTPNGICVASAPIVVRDAAGRTATVTVSNARGTDAVPALAVSPSNVTLSSCSSIASVTATGGTGRYVASAGSGALFVTNQTSSTFQIQRNPSSSATATPLNVGISDGSSTVNVTVNLTGPATGPCPTPAFRADPPGPVTLFSCTSPVTVTLSGGSGTYSASSGAGSITVSISGNTVSIRRAPGSSPLRSGFAEVFVSDGVAAPIKIEVDDDPPGACP